MSPANIRQQGMAIIAALVVVAAAAVATTAIIERQATLADTLSSARDYTQANWLLRGGLDWSRMILFEEARRNAITRKGGVWNQPIAGLEISTPHDSRKAYFSGQIEDEQSKFNLWGLAIQGKVQAKELAALEKLLASLDLPAQLAIAISQRVAQTQTKLDDKPVALGLRNLGDLLGIKGMSPQIVESLASYLTILPQKTTVNANTASAEVLSASIPSLDLAQARQLTDQRDSGLWFNNRADFFNRINDPKIDSENQIGINSEWFKVTGQVIMDKTVVSMQALLHREGNQPPAIRWIKN